MIPQARPASSLLEHLVRMEFPGWLFIPELGNFNLYHFLVFIFCQELVSDLEEDARNTTSRKASGEATSSQGNYHPTSVRVRASACLSAFGQPLSSRTLNRSLGLIALIVTHWSWTPQTLDATKTPQKPIQMVCLFFWMSRWCQYTEYRWDQLVGHFCILAQFLGACKQTYRETYRVPCARLSPVL